MGGGWEWLRPPDNYEGEGDEFANLELFPWFPIDHMPNLRS
jgi:hypothetical protein